MASRGFAHFWVENLYCLKQSLDLGLWIIISVGESYDVSFNLYVTDLISPEGSTSFLFLQFGNLMLSSIISFI